MSFKLFAQSHEINLSTGVYFNADEIFYSHQGATEFTNTLAMNVKYEPVKNLIPQIEKALNLKLLIFTGWNPNGEAHVTVITPPEFFHVLKSKLSMDDIDKIAQRYEIQNARLMIQGLGSAKKFIEGKEEETFFLIVDSFELRNIRQQIYYEFIRRGGSPSAFDPSWFFPHITIGFTKRDLHETDGVIKNLKNSFDPRFKLIKKGSIL